MLVGCEARGQEACLLFGSPSQCSQQDYMDVGDSRGRILTKLQCGKLFRSGLKRNGFRVRAVEANALWRVLVEGRTSHSQSLELWDDSLLLPQQLSPQKVG